MKINLTVIACLIITSCFASNDSIYTWDTTPKYAELSPENETENMVGIFYHEKDNYYYDGEQKELKLINIIHKKIRVNNNESIGDINKISVSLTNVIKLIEIKARSIKPDGSIIEFDENSIREIKDEEKGNSYKIFAIDGIETGDDIEFYIIRKMDGSYFGRCIFQNSYPIQQASYELTCPKNLSFDIKGYNGFPSAKLSEENENIKKYVCLRENIPAIKAEKFSFLTPRKERIEYRLDYNIYAGKNQLLTWNDAAKRIYNILYKDIEQKIIDKWAKEINLKSKSKLEQIKIIEDYLKSNIYIQDFNTPHFENLNFVYENKVTNKRGIVTIYANLLKKFDINHEIVLTSHRDKIRFDGDFQSWNYLVDYLIYFPDLDMYIDPVVTGYRLGCVEGTLTATEGLFIKIIRIGTFESAVGTIAYIKPSTYKDNYYNMKIDIHIDIDDLSTNVNTIRGLKGLSGGSLHHYYKMMDEEQKQNLFDTYLESGKIKSTINKTEVLENTSIDFMKDAEFIFESDITTNDYIDIAGNKLLLKVGETIGTQAEMYFEKERKSDIENTFNRSYLREINVYIPEGYKISNPEATVFNYTTNINNETVFCFVSSYTIENNIYKITIEEYYNDIYADKKYIEEYTQVINAAADFNKVVLLIEEE